MADEDQDDQTDHAGLTASSDDQSSKKRRRLAPATTAALIAATGAVIAAAVAASVTGFFGLADDSSQGPGCDEFPIDVAYPGAPPGPTAPITLTEHCAPDEGREFLRVTEAKGIGDDQHSEFYPKKADLPAGKATTITINIGKDPDGQENCIFVVEPTYAEAQDLLSQLSPEGFVTTFPALRRVSQSACGRTTHSSRGPASTATSSSSASATITYPKDNDAVSQRIAPKGTVANLHGGYTLFLLLDFDGCFFAESTSVNGSTWSANMEIGGAAESGHAFTLCAVITTQNLTNEQRDQKDRCFSSLDELKRKYDVTVLTTNQIMRR